MPSTGISGRNTATPASNEEHDDVLTDGDESVVGVDEFQSGLKGRTAAQDDLEEMWTMLEEEAGDGRESDSESGGGNKSFTPISGAQATCRHSRARLWRKPSDA